MTKCIVQNVPRYFGAHAHDCFTHAYSAVIAHMGYNPDLILADYLSFMYDDESGYFGMNHLFVQNLRVEFSEEELNTSLAFLYFPGTAKYDGQPVGLTTRKDRININWYIHDDDEIAYQRAKQLIDANIPLIAFADIFYMPYHAYHQKDHQIHAFIITGYDEENGTVELFDKHLISGSDFDGVLPKEVVRLARSSENPVVNPVVGKQTRPIRNLWVEITAGEDFKATDEMSLEIIRESCRRMLGQVNVLGQPCGLERIEAFRKGLDRMKEKPFDEKDMHLFRHHFMLCFKSLNRSRIRFKLFIETVRHLLPEDVVSEVCANLDDSAKCFNICGSLSLKIGISKRWTAIDDLNAQLASIMQLEGNAINKLAECVGAGIK